MTKMCRSSTLLAKSQVQKFTGMKCGELPKSLLSSLQTLSVNNSGATLARGKSAGQQTLPVQSDVTFWFCHLSGAGTEEQRYVCQAHEFQRLAGGSASLEEVVALRWIKGPKNLSPSLPHLPPPLSALPSHTPCFPCHPNRLSPQPEHQAERRVSMEHDWETGSHLVSLYISLCSDWHWRWAWQAPHFPPEQPTCTRRR